MSDFDDPFVRDQLQREAGHFPDDDTSYASMMQRVRVARRRRAFAVIGGLGAAAAIGISVASIANRDTHQLSQAANTSFNDPVLVETPTTPTTVVTTTTEAPTTSTTLPETTTTSTLPDTTTTAPVPTEPPTLPTMPQAPQPPKTTIATKTTSSATIPVTAPTTPSAPRTAAPAPAAPPTAAPPVTTQPVVAPLTTAPLTTQPAPAGDEMRFFNDFGKVVVRVNGSTMTLVSVDTKDGFTYVVRENGPGRVRVMFNKGSAKLDVLVLFRHGEVIQRIRGSHNDPVNSYSLPNKLEGGATRSTATRYGENGSIPEDQSAAAERSGDDAGHESDTG